MCIVAEREEEGLHIVLSRSLALLSCINTQWPLECRIQVEMNKLSLLAMLNSFACISL